MQAPPAGSERRYQDEFIQDWSELVEDMDTGVLAAPARMESDPSGAIRDAAVAEHAANYWPHPEARKTKFRNSTRRRRDGSLWSWDIASSIHDGKLLTRPPPSSTSEPPRTRRL